MLLSDFCTTQNTILLFWSKVGRSTLALSHLSSICNTCANYLEAPLANSLNILLSAQSGFETLCSQKHPIFNRRPKDAFPPHPGGKWARAKINFPKTGVWVSACDRVESDTHSEAKSLFQQSQPAAPRAKSSFKCQLWCRSDPHTHTHTRTRRPKGFCCWQMWRAQMSFRRQCQPANATRLLKVISRGVNRILSLANAHFPCAHLIIEDSCGNCWTDEMKCQSAATFLNSRQCHLHQTVVRKLSLWYFKNHFI
jgi:hypothetical protein